MKKSPDCQDRKCKDGVLEEQETPSGGKYNILCPVCYGDTLKALKECAPPRFKPEKSE